MVSSSSSFYAPFSSSASQSSSASEPITGTYHGAFAARSKSVPRNMFSVSAPGLTAQAPSGWLKLEAWLN